MRVFILVLLSVTSLTGCDFLNNEQVKESVLQPGQIVEANNRNGTIKITYIGLTKRQYEWEGERRVVRLQARQEPFLGQLGLYDPADAWIFSHETRLVLEEAIRKFETEDQIKAALVQSSAYTDWVYTPDGLVVGYGRNPARRQIDIDVYQFLLRGKKPSGLAGARPDQIRLIGK